MEHRRVDKLVEDRNLAALEDLFCIGDSHGECLTYFGRPKEAAEVPEKVLELRKKWTTDAEGIATT